MDKAAGLLGGLVGGGLSGRGYVGKEPKIGANARIAPFGNRTEHPIGKYPHYHRRVPDPANPGVSKQGQGVKRHRPWESKPSDKTFWDRFRPLNHDGHSRPIVPPVFVYGDGTLDAFDSPESAALYNEPVDVSAGLCAVAFDAHGQKLELYVVEEEVKQRIFFWTWTMKLERTKIRMAREQPPDTEAYRRVLLEHLQSMKPTLDVAQKTFGELVELAFPLARTK